MMLEHNHNTGYHQQHTLPIHVIVNVRHIGSIPKAERNKQTKLVRIISQK